MIILVRHGEADHHVHDLTGGWTDSALTETGCQQIKNASNYIAGLLVGREKPQILASNLLRARQSAQIIAEKLSVPVSCSEFLREKNNGLAAGKSSVEAKKLKLPKHAEAPDQRNYPGGETQREFFERVAKGMDDLVLPEEPLLIVAHKGTIHNILFWWLRLSIDQVCSQAISFNIKPASVTVLNINAWHENEISLLNHTA